MFQQSARANGGAGEDRSVFQKGLSLMGSALGVGVSIVATPPLFDATRGPLAAYLAKTWDQWLANLLTWVMGGVEAVVIYVAVKLAVVLGVTFGAAWIAARGFPGVRP